MDDIIRRVEQYLTARGHVITEGSASASEMRFLTEYIAERPKLLNICEIGFNAGLSASAFLSARENIRVVSFDIFDHDYAADAQKLVEATYPGRHTMVKGDSKVTVPVYQGGQMPFDFVFVDGGHDLATAKADLINAARLSSVSTSVMIDDLTPWEPWGIGPTAAWQELVRLGMIRQDGLWSNGEVITTISGTRGDRVWAIGTYTARALQSE
ncbi:MAG TPA: class I SAM-dependent methyltransferase [Candidatus Saccharimonadia bacterium]|nr:class I SAM-dependent methyltransferase [Candidatus Saccharimonadia bacterium]